MSWERTEYKNIIKDLKTNLTSQIMNATSGEELRDLTASVVTHFRKLIKDFFSSDEGEGDQIKKMYANVYDYNPCKKRINIQDMNSCFNTYMNYMDGMNVYINNTMRDSSDGIEDTISKYMEKDESFIESLFGGGTNAKHAENVTIQEALVNLEILIDYIPKLDASSDVMNRLLSSCNADSGTSPVCMKLMKFYLLSIVRYSARLVGCVFDSFYQIVDVMSGPVIKKESVKPEPFKLLL